MRGNIVIVLLMMILAGGVVGCGKEDPEVREGVNPLEERSKGMPNAKEKSNPMMPKGKPGAR